MRIRSIDAPWMEDDPDLPAPAAQEAISDPVVSRSPDAETVLLTLNRLLSFAEVVAKYGGPPEVWDKFRPDLPVWDHHNGEPVYLESAVDEFLRHRQPGATVDAAIPTGDDAIISLEQAAQVVHVSPQDRPELVQQRPRQLPATQGRKRSGGGTSSAGGPRRGEARSDGPTSTKLPSRKPGAMPRPPKNQPLALIDGREVHATLKLRAGIYAVQFPDPNRAGKYREVSTRERHPLGAWAKAREIIESAYANAEPDRPAGPVTWDEVVALLPDMPGLLRPRAVEPYVGAIANLRKFVETSGPFDVTPEKAKRFRTAYEAQPFTRGKPKRAKTGSEPTPPKGYKRKPKTVENAIRRLSALWVKLLARKPTPLARLNPWLDVERPVVTADDPVAADEADWQHFFGWLEAKRWELMSVFLHVKALAGCRTNDLCHVKADQWDRRTRLLTILPGEDKTYQKRTIPIPPDLARRLDAVAGTEYLWDRYAASLQSLDRPRVKDGFRPKRLYWAVRRVFEGYEGEHPDRTKLTPHDLRGRAITLTVEKTQSIDATAEMIKVSAATVQRHYLDRQRAFRSQELFKEMADVLVVKPGTSTEDATG